MRQAELRLQALARELDECRWTLQTALDRYRRDLRRRQNRRRRVLVTLALTLVLAAGFATADTPSFGASTDVPATCAPGTPSVPGATFHISGTTATATFTVGAGCTGTQITLASYEKLGGPTQLFGQTLYQSTTVVLDPGVHVLTIQLPTCFWQVDLATGTALPTIDATHLYAKRLVIADQGGTQACSPPTTSTTTTGTTSTTGTTTTQTTTTGTTTTTTTTGTTTTGTTTTGTTTTGTTATSTTSATGTTSTGSTTTQSGTTTSASTGTTTPVTPTGTPSTDVSITKVANRTQASVGQQISYLITVTNKGPSDALAVVVVDQLPTQESLVSVDDPACGGTTVITCSFGTLAAGATRSVTVVALAAAAGVATNTATVTTTTPETDTTNNQARTTVTISGPFVPPGIRTTCAALSLRHSPLVAGRSATVSVSARRNGRPVARVRVELHGAGIDVVERTQASGIARFVVTPHGAGVLRVRLLQSPSCSRALQEVPVPGAFRPPLLTG